MTTLVSDLKGATIARPLDTVIMGAIAAGAAWAGRFVTLGGFASPSPLVGGVFAVITDRVARFVEPFLKRAPFIGDTKAKLAVTEKDTEGNDVEKSPAVKAKVNNYRFIVNYVVGGAIATGVCLGLAAFIPMIQITAIQAVALGVLSLALSKAVPAAIDYITK